MPSHFGQQRINAFNGSKAWLGAILCSSAMEKLQEKIDILEEKLKQVEEDKGKAEKRWQAERNEILVNAQEVITEGDRRMEETVKEVEKRLKEEMEEVNQKAVE